MDAHTPTQNALIGAGLLAATCLGAAGIYSVSRQFEEIFAAFETLPLLSRVCLSWQFHAVVPALTALAYARLLTGARHGLTTVACTGALILAVGLITFVAMYLPIFQLGNQLNAVE